MKKLLTVLLALMLVVTMFASCTKTSNGGDGNNDVSGNENGTGAENGAQLVIGGIGPLTGDYANYGNSVKNGVELAAAEINAAGGVNGYTLVVNFQDSKGDPQQATQAYGKLVDSGMKVSLGGVLSGETAAVSEAAIEDEMLVLTPSGSAVSAIADSEYAFRVCFSDPSQGVASAQYIVDYDLPKEVAVFYASDTDYSTGLYETFKQGCEENGITIVTEQTFTAASATDFSAQIAEIRDSGVKLVYIPIYAQEAAVFLTQAKGKLADDVIFFGCDGLDGILTKIDDPANAENVMMLTPFAADSTDEKTQSFVAAYKTAYNNETPDQFAADGYDAVYVIKAALEHAGLTPDNEEDFNAKMVSAMTEITVDGVTGTMTWTADGETTKDAKAMIIHDGVAAVYEKAADAE